MQGADQRSEPSSGTHRAAASHARDDRPDSWDEALPLAVVCHRRRASWVSADEDDCSIRYRPTMSTATVEAGRLAITRGSSIQSLPSFGAL